MNGKEKCKALKEIRQQIAEKNDIAFAVSECTHQGDCKGTCPKCEAELRYLERQLELKKSLGKAVAVAGISVGACTMMTACTPADAIDEIFSDIQAIFDDNGYEYEGGISEFPETGEIAPIELEGDIILEEE